jgi:hypothetical protein
MLNIAKAISEHALAILILKRVQRKFSSVFSETAANYEAFFQMRIKIKNLNIKMTRQKKNLKPSAYIKKIPI